jgi:hypothetical protein
VLRASHIALRTHPEEKTDEIPEPEPTKPSDEQSKTRRRLDQAAEMYLDSGAIAKELLQALAEAKIVTNIKILAERAAKGVEWPEWPSFSGEA